jgi:histidinol dehydrogenase
LQRAESRFAHWRRRAGVERGVDEPTAIRIAEAEGLQAHANAVAIRLGQSAEAAP